MQRIAIIDIGSNSARLVVSHIYKNGAYNMVYNQKEALRLSQKVDGQNMLTEEAFTSTIDTMRSFAHMCKVYQADKTIAVATAAIRNATNGAELVAKVAEETGIQLHIISGKTEAYISYLGVINTLDVKNGIIFDLGGGSTELILFKNRKILESVSLPLGAVNTTGMFNIRNEMPPNVYNDVSAFVMSRLNQYPWLKQNNLPLIGVGGTARTVAKIIQRAKKYPATKIHNYAYPMQTFRSFFNKLRLTNLEQRKKISGLSTERSDIILAGSSIISCLLEATGAKKLITSGCGLREGLFYDYYSKSNNVPLIAKNILERSRENTLSLFEADTAHARHITKLALAMFDGWMELHKVRKSYRRLLDGKLARDSLEIRPVLETGRADLICRLVEQNIGMTFLPDYVTEEGVREGKLVRLNVPDFRMSVWKQILYRRDKWVSLPMRVMIDHLAGIRPNPERTDRRQTGGSC